jgi:hypothetical protein
MASSRRDRNKNCFVWEPVKDGNNRFTPNVPLNCFYEIIEMTESLPSEEEEYSLDVGFLPDQDEQAAAKKLLRMTPSNEELLKIAKLYPPPPEWFEKDEERPF